MIHPRKGFDAYQIQLPLGLKVRADSVSWQLLTLASDGLLSRRSTLEVVNSTKFATGFIRNFRIIWIIID